MELKRLWNTLTFFDVLPFSRCLASLFNSEQKQNTRYLSTMNVILLYFSNETIQHDHEVALRTRTIQTSLQKLNLPLRILNASSANITPYPNTEIINITSHEDLTPSLLERVTDIICCNQEDAQKMITLIEKSLNPSEILLSSFQNPNQYQSYLWGAVDDVVMGGVSSSNLILGQNKAIFTGNVSTNNNGGFVSVRSKNFTPPLDLSLYEGIRLRIQGDGQRYKFITRCEGKWDGISYCYSFDTIANVWMTINIPFTDLIPVFRAKIVKDADKFDRTQLYSLQLMLSKFEYDGEYNPTFRSGLFSLEIESIKAYGRENSPRLILLGNSYQINTSLLKVYAQTVEDIEF
ncbi:CIA30 family protein [Geminocystis sp. CENA526]|uniref:CIA30 family protein n=1 Tax=Geminocystis sp. CENA526 TaxID=1355871 RepID=UPI003D6F3BFB